MFMEEFGMTETGLVRLICMSYDLLGLQTFSLPERRSARLDAAPGGTAKEAAGVIHTDLKRDSFAPKLSHMKI